ncbi:MAG TPA: class I SAM-dependent methyltransferase [Propionicimonas sp.]|jgi:SAM-dependent methyltransferase|nr:class I SAM-dependent methyltransferase [Propionicimonas sp.]
MVRSTSWQQYRTAIGDRSDMFRMIVETWPIDNALYPGSYVDVSPSSAIPVVTYVDTDARAARYFADPSQVATELRDHRRPGSEPRVHFLAADYTQPLPIADGSVELVISLFAGPVWDHCGRYLRPGGWLLANNSHGDASIASLDPSLRLVGAIHHGADRYRLRTNNLADFLIPKRPETADLGQIRRAGRGIAFTRSAFAYVFEKL